MVLWLVCVEMWQVGQCGNVAMCDNVVMCGMCWIVLHCIPQCTVVCKILAENHSWDLWVNGPACPVCPVCPGEFQAQFDISLNTHTHCSDNNTNITTSIPK